MFLVSRVVASFAGMTHSFAFTGPFPRSVFKRKTIYGFGPNPASMDFGPERNFFKGKRFLHFLSRLEGLISRFILFEA